MYKIAMVLRCVAWLTASREARLGRRVSERVVASRVWGLGGECYNLWRVCCACCVWCVCVCVCVCLGLRR